MDTNNAVTTEDLANIEAGIARNNPNMNANRVRLLALLTAEGADAKLIETIARAVTAREGLTVKLRVGKYDHLSRGRGCCRSSHGTFADASGEWYTVAAGKWTVHSSDGFARSEKIAYTVRTVTVGSVTATYAV